MGHSKYPLGWRDVVRAMLSKSSLRLTRMLGKLAKAIIMTTRRGPQEMLCLAGFGTREHHVIYRQYGGPGKIVSYLAWVGDWLTDLRQALLPSVTPT
ncbi:hypothetical protein J6590_003532 [Homalodisca vitripennis]|nr:hypothetical protein J6590_003532 [Homalodisca vitripennis]